MVEEGKTKVAVTLHYLMRYITLARISAWMTYFLVNFPAMLDDVFQLINWPNCHWWGLAPMASLFLNLFLFARILNGGHRKFTWLRIQIRGISNFSSKSKIPEPVDRTWYYCRIISQIKIIRISTVK
jgi:hypothetical protein